MKKIILTALLSFAFLSTAHANNLFELTKANVANTNIGKNISGQLNGLDSCLDSCYYDFGDCLYSGEYDFICEIIFDECENECYDYYQ
jgi:hypothetical protein